MMHYYRNKHLLGDLTLGDLLKIVELEGEFTVGRNWLPIVKHRVSRTRKTLLLFMDSVGDTVGDAEMEVPLVTRVKVEGRVARMKIEGHGYPTNTSVQIRFDREVEFP